MFIVIHLEVNTRVEPCAPEGIGHLANLQALQYISIH